ncbi:hypothetical protein G6L20_32335 [Agrobacterium rhizogenes]|nr:hypothetical protein [Rhizobium rhizogenes]
MLVDFDCYQTTINAIEPGAIFAASIGEQTTFCLSVQSDSGSAIPSLLTIWPGHPMMKNKIGLLHGEVISEHPILVYRAARIVPSPNPEHLDLEPYGSFRSSQIGSLLLIGEEYYIQATTGQGRAVFACSDGARFKTSNDASQRVIFTSWEIMIAGPGGEPHTLCVIDTTSDRMA